ncbi:MAG: hypothetical protein K6G26_09550 [Lachnospiraceae bacterium]|nr:hypothetical protein [Lachnospiraceae bacterium]
MYDKKSLTGYSIISIGLPLGVYVTAMFGKGKICDLAYLSLAFIAVVVMLFSIKVLMGMFFDRDNSYADGEFVIKYNCILLATFAIRYMLICVSQKLPFNSSIIMDIIAAPVITLLFIGFLKNYCLNTRTVLRTMLVSIILIYVVLPLVIQGLEMLIGDEYIVMSSVYYKFFGYNYAANRILMGACRIFGINIPGKLLFVTIGVVNLIIWCIMYLPYMVISAVVVDERSYMDKGIFINTMIIITITAMMLLGIFWVSILCEKGTFELDYNIFHNL